VRLVLAEAAKRRIAAAAFQARSAHERELLVAFGSSSRVVRVVALVRGLETVVESTP
jgi:hypothetical protein